jgi:hypothetical protein
MTASRNIRPIRSKRFVKRVIGLLTPVLACGICAMGGEAASPNYRLGQFTLNSAGTTSESAGYRLDASLGQASTVGASASPKYVMQSGFWSFVGSGLVPVVLAVDRNGGTPGNVDLFWSGNNAPYEVFRSDDCANVFGGFFGSTSSNTFENLAPPPGELTCFNVLATAPGPK